MDSLQRDISENVRARREALGLSLAQLASRAGIAKSTLSQLESGAANPTIGTLSSLARILAMDLSELITPVDIPDPVVVMRAGEGRDVSGDGLDGLLVHAQRSGSERIEFHSLYVRPNIRTISPSHGDGAHEYAYVVSGAVELGPIDRTEIAHAGDFVSYPADGLHVWASAEGQGGLVWLLATFPQFASH